jgi:hypothetical protein
LPPVKIQGDIAESEYENPIALWPTNVKGEGIKLKTTFAIKKYYIGF